MDLLPHQERVLTEQSDLFEKIVKLKGFIRSEAFAALPRDEQNRLVRQCALMQGYVEVLDERIEAFLKGGTAPSYHGA